MQRRPGAHVTPAGVERHHDRGMCLLHHRIVDGVARTGAELGGRQAREVEVAVRGLERCLAGAQHHGCKPAQLLKIASRPKEEHAAVPEVVARSHILGCALGVGLFDELGDRIHRTRAGGAANVSVADLGLGRHDAEGHELAGRCGHEARTHRRMKGRDVLEQVIGGHHEQHRLRILPRRRPDRGQRRDRDGGRRVPADGLQHDRGRRHAELAQLLGNHEAVMLVAHDDRPRGVQALEPTDRVLQHRLVADQR